MHLTRPRSWLGVGAVAAAAIIGTAPVAMAAPVAAPPASATTPTSTSGGHGTLAAGRSAPISPLFTDITLARDANGIIVIEWTYGSWVVDIVWGFDYNPSTNHLAAYAQMASNSSSTHLQAEPLNLGDRNGVLKSKYANSQTGYLEIDTPVVGCHYPNGVYISNLHYSIRWPNGTLTSNQQTDQYTASASFICV